MESVDAELLAAGSNVLGSQHGGVGRRLITVGLDLHATSDTADGLTATGITRVSLNHSRFPISFRGAIPTLRGSCVYIREIGDVDEGVVERGEDAGNAEDELA